MNKHEQHELGLAIVWADIESVKRSIDVAELPMTSLPHIITIIILVYRNKSCGSMPGYVRLPINRYDHKPSFLLLLFILKMCLTTNKMFVNYFIWLSFYVILTLTSKSSNLTFSVAFYETFIKDTILVYKFF